MFIARTVEGVLIRFTCYQDHFFCYGIVCLCKYLVIKNILIQHVQGNNKKTDAEKDANTKHMLLKESITATSKLISMQIYAKLLWQQMYPRVRLEIRV